MPIGVETFLQPALQPVFDLIISEGAELFRRLTGSELNVILKIWNSQLKMINGLLDDAMNMRIKSKAVQIRLEELQDLAFDMEDILADFEFEAQKHEFNINTADQQDDDEEDGVAQGVINAVNNMVAKFSDTVSTSMSTLTTTISPDIQSKIKDIKTRLERLQPFELVKLTNKQQQQTLQTEALRSERETSALQLESNVYGRDEGKQKIITRLLNDDGVPSNETYVVIPIVGCGGIGKTTLAQWVYNDEKVKGHFDLMAWVCVSDVFDVKRITITIFNEATTTNGTLVRAATGSGTLDKSSSLNAAQTQLMQILMGKKFLIVLDDVWDCKYSDWQRLKTPFKHAAKGSRVIMTTRNEPDARTMINCPTRDTFIRLKGLSDEECWNLFQQHANNDSDLAEMRDDIVKKCEGIPLAAKALGGLFKKTEDKSERQMILKSNIWSEGNIWGEDIDILLVLRLSYDYLPSHLKRVFAYLSLFPKDRKFEKMEVILLWMSQGFLPNDELMEDSGHKYFNDLGSRSLLEQCPYDERRFIMHDLVHDLALWAAGGICYARGAKNMTRVDRERIRHVVLTEDEDATSLLSQLKASRLRTFIDVGFIMNLDFIQSFNYVRTLWLVSETIKVLPECIGELKHLRFLILKFDSLTELPEAINNLWDLQTLWLACSDLKKVPYIGSLKKLRHLVLYETLAEMPRGFEKLTSLRSLDSFKLVDRHGYRIKELKNLNHLQGELTIHGLENVSTVEDAKEAQLHQKSGLDELCLEWGTCEEQVDYDTVKDVVEQLRPATSIKKCKLDGYMGLILPGWLGDPSFNNNNIVTIELSECTKCEELPPLGELPYLKTLDIQKMGGLKRVGVEFYGLSNPFPFPALESLKFMHLKRWEKWEHIAVDSNNRAFPCLQSLKIHDCGSLQGNLPPFLPSLKTLEIQTCRELSVSVSLPNLPLLEVLMVDDCKSVSITTEDVKQGVSEEGNTPTELVHLHLTQLSIWNCPGLISLPEHLALKHLTDLSIDNCPGLISLPEHLLLPALKHLSICKNMERLPSEMHKYTSLQDLYISECPKLQCFPEGGGLPENLKQLDIDGDIKGVQQWGLHRLHSLEKLFLNLKDVETEEDFNLSLPSSSLREVIILKTHNLKNLRVVDGTNLKHLEIRFCNKLESLEVVDGTNLKHLEILFCNKLESLEVANFTCPSSTLKLWSCPKLKSLPPLFPTQFLGLSYLGSSTDAIEKIPGPNLELPSSLKELSIEGFQNLKTITCSTLPNLERLRIRRCPKFESFGDTALPSHLKHLEIGFCNKLESLEVANFNSLSTLKLWSCPKLKSLPPLSPTFISELELYDLGSSTDAIEKIPGPNLELPSSLKELIIGGFQNLKTITCSTLPNLTTLRIKCCPKFESFGDTALPSHLKYVYIEECELIKPHLQRDPHNGVIWMDDGRYSLRHHFKSSTSMSS